MLFLCLIFLCFFAEIYGRQTDSVSATLPPIVVAFTAINQVPREWISFGRLEGLELPTSLDYLKFVDVWNSTERAVYLSGGVQYDAKNNKLMVPCSDFNGIVNLCVGDLNSQKMKITPLNLDPQIALTAIILDFKTNQNFVLLTESIGENAVASSFASFDVDTGSHENLLDFGDYGLVSYAIRSDYQHAYFITSNRANYSDARCVTYDLISKKVLYNVSTYIGIQDLQFDTENSVLYAAVNSKQGGSYVSELDPEFGTTKFRFSLAEDRVVLGDAKLQGKSDFRNGHWFLMLTDRVKTFACLISPAENRIVRQLEYDQPFLGGLAFTFSK